MSSQRSGLSWIEVLVLILVLGLLAVMMLPAVERSGEAARRAACSNNLKQLVLAVHSYHDAHNEVVPLSAGGEGTASWVTLLMPYMEQRSAWNALVETGTLDLQGSQEAREIFAGFTSSTFICPSRRAPMLSRSQGMGFEATPSDYAVCNSTTNCWAIDAANFNGRQASGSIVFPAKPTPEDTAEQPQGTFSFGGITDGLSYTAFFGEKHLYKRDPLGTLAAGDANALTIGNSPAWFNSSIRRMGNLPDPHNPQCAPVGTGILTAKDPQPQFPTFGSWHPAVCQFGMGDGSVQTLRNDLDPRICAALIQRNDGEAVVLDE